MVRVCVFVRDWFLLLLLMLLLLLLLLLLLCLYGSCRTTCVGRQCFGRAVVVFFWLRFERFVFYSYRYLLVLLLLLWFFLLLLGCWLDLMLLKSILLLSLGMLLLGSIGFALRLVSCGAVGRVLARSLPSPLTWPKARALGRLLVLVLYITCGRFG